MVGTEGQKRLQNKNEVPAVRGLDRRNRPVDDSEGLGPAEVRDEMIVGLQDRTKPLT